MNPTEFITFAGLASLILATQLGHRRLSLRRLLLPFVAVGVVAYHYLPIVPTAGGDLDFEVGLSLAGAVCGVLAASLMSVKRDDRTGEIATEAGVDYAALWVLVFGGRMAFAWAASHGWSHQVAQFSLQHDITGSTAWTAAFILMALSMVVTRTAVTGARALLIARPGSLPLANA